MSRTDIDIEGSIIEGGLDRELNRDAVPLSPPLAGPELSSLLLPTLTLDNHAKVVICAERPATYPRLIVPALSLSSIAIAFPGALEEGRVATGSWECRRKLSFRGRSGCDARTSTNIARWPTGAENAGGRSEAIGRLLNETRSSKGIGIGDSAGVFELPTFCISDSDRCHRQLAG